MIMCDDARKISTGTDFGFHVITTNAFVLWRQNGERIISAVSRSVRLDAGAILLVQREDLLAVGLETAFLAR
jgi:hypothetical protein